MSNLVKVSLRETNISWKRPKKRPTSISNNWHDPQMITRTHTKTGKIISGNVPISPDYNLDCTLTHQYIMEPGSNMNNPW